MKKSIVLGLAAIMTLAASVASFANAAESIANTNHHEGSSVEFTSQGTGACRHGGCSCSRYVRMEGGAGKCTCGHWDYVHN